MVESFSSKLRAKTMPSEIHASGAIVYREPGTLRVRTVLLSTSIMMPIDIYTERSDGTIRYASKDFSLFHTVKAD